MLHKEFWGMLFLGFIAWVFIAGTPSDRINHFCRPIVWTGNAVTSLSALAVPSQQENVKGWFTKFDYGCRYMTWRLFYQDDYNTYMKEQQGAAAASASATTQPATAAKAASAASAGSAPAAEK
jgi:hypothetical protein